jgi:hypothetical protein
MKFCQFLLRVFALALCFTALAALASAQDVQEMTVVGQTQAKSAPLTLDEFRLLIFQLQKHPERRDAVASEIRTRGLGFALNDGLRSFIASKSGNDALIRRTVEEAERRRVNPSAAKPPTEAEAREVLAKAKQETIAATEAMPDFVVRQLIARSYALGTSENWHTQDHLTLAVSYRATGGEKYRLLAVNGIPQQGSSGDDNSDYERTGGTRSMGEYVSWLADLFKDETHAEFHPVDTDTLQGRRTIVYEFSVKRENSKQTLKFDKLPPVVAAYRGRVWIDRENFRVLRLENISTDIPPYPITATSSTIDYGWIEIAGKKYLLPVHADIQLTTVQNRQTYQTRNEIRFRNYQKYGTEVKVIEDDDVVDESNQPAPPKKP